MIREVEAQMTAESVAHSDAFLVNLVSRRDRQWDLRRYNATVNEIIIIFVNEDSPSHRPSKQILGFRGAINQHLFPNPHREPGWQSN